MVIKNGTTLGVVFSNFRLTKHEKSFFIMSACILQRKKWGLFSWESLQELQIKPESENFEVTLLKYKLFLNSLSMNCFK